MTLLVTGGVSRRLTASTAGRLLEQIVPADVVELERKLVARELLADRVHLDEQLETNRLRLPAAVGASDTGLTPAVRRR